MNVTSPSSATTTPSMTLNSTAVTMPPTMRMPPMDLLLSTTGRGPVINPLGILCSVNQPHEHKRDADAGKPRGDEKSCSQSRAFRIAEPTRRQHPPKRKVHDQDAFEGAWGVACCPAPHAGYSQLLRFLPLVQASVPASPGDCVNSELTATSERLDRMGDPT
jgi:hypothetical protein